MTNKMIVLLATPQVRAMVPPEMIEGQWREIPEHMKEIVFGYVDPEVADETVVWPAEVPMVITLRAEPSGRMMRRDFDGATAQVWEIRKAWGES